ncbi:II family cellulose-binding protein [Tenacibaculum holothuriorum]|uniref:II family cellulose-binding protein n=2 Tax=Tenacibaculum holothuriorum TaxID=1635173 RepID=A0A1Y2PC61_9FLAO|nr:II family cellulose-binding protein [Tenacibaculum holothuriorum]
MDVSTPALLFGSISLLLLAYTNRFTAVARFIRELNDNKKNCEKVIVDSQIPVLRKRIKLIKRMQVFGVISFILCTGSLFALFFENQLTGKLFFTVSISSLLISLVYVLWEATISTKALDIILDNTQQHKNI